VSGRGPNRWLLLLLAAALVLVDQLSKAWASRVLAGQGAVGWIPGLLQLRLTRNTGAAFSLFTGLTPALGLLSFVVSLTVLIWLLRGQARRGWQGVAAALLLAGSLGNGLDRWRLGYVVDFLELVPISFPIFNGADVAINLAVLCFALDLFRSHGRHTA
jgi:signal peptidase II